MFLRRLCLGVLLAITAGCESSPRADYSVLGLVHPAGTVTLDGQPLTNAVVTFEDPATGNYSYGLTDSAGRYSGLRIDSQAAGVTPGEKLVRISTSRKILGLNSSEEGAVEEPADKNTRKGDPEGKVTEKVVEQVPAKYNKSSELRVTVDAAHLEHDFQLASK